MAGGIELTVSCDSYIKIILHFSKQPELRILDYLTGGVVRCLIFVTLVKTFMLSTKSSI